MPWIEEEIQHRCDLPAEVRHNAKWYCSECGLIWKTVYKTLDVYDFINDRPYGKIWMYEKTKERMTL